MLRQYGLKATFYISPQNQEFRAGDLLTTQEIQNLSLNFEIGAHTLTHRILPTISEEEARKEITGSKSVLEEITGNTVNAFCYPRGAFTESHVELVKAAGFRYARTVQRYAFSLNNPYKAGTSLHICSYRAGRELLRSARFVRFRPIETWRCLEWGVLGRVMFDYFLDNGGIFHIWGHSWEIDKNDDWRRLEDFFKYISGHPRINYVTNGELASYS